MKRWALVYGLMLAAVTTSAHAADEPPAWHVDVTPYVWAAGIYGDVSVGRRTAPVSASSVDILVGTTTSG